MLALLFPIGGCSSLRCGAKKMQGFGGSRASPALICSQKTDSCSRPGSANLKILKMAREKFTEEISRPIDRDVSLAKALLLVAAEDEAFIAFNREIDAHSVMNEMNDVPSSFKAHLDCCAVEEIPLCGMNISGWLNKLDMIAKEVEAELVSRDIGCYLVEIVEAVNAVLFESRGFKRFSVLADPKFSYLHSVLNSACGSAIMLSVVYIEICQRLGVSMVGSRVGEDFLIWPQTRNPEELFKAYSGRSLFAIVNGRCVEDPRSKASDLNSSALLGLDIASNRDTIGIALANLIRLHWKQASRMNRGLMLTSPLRPILATSCKESQMDTSKVSLLRPQEIRLRRVHLDALSGQTGRIIVGLIAAYACSVALMAGFFSFIVGMGFY